MTMVHEYTMIQGTSMYLSAMWSSWILRNHHPCRNLCTGSCCSLSDLHLLMQPGSGFLEWERRNQNGTWSVLMPIMVRAILMKTGRKKFAACRDELFQRGPLQNFCDMYQSSHDEFEHNGVMYFPSSHMINMDHKMEQNLLEIYQGVSKAYDRNCLEDFKFSGGTPSRLPKNPWRSRHLGGGSDKTVDKIPNCCRE